MDRSSQAATDFVGAPQRPRRRWRRSGSAAILSLLFGALFMVLSPWSSGVTPELHPEVDNQTCGDLEGPGQTWTELKIDPNGNGTYTQGPLTVVISNTQNDKTFNWSSNIGVDAVYVKAGSAGSYLYRYDPPTESTGDTGLTSPGTGSENQISHISFCWDPDPAQARISITPDGANQVGDPHELTVTVEKKGSLDPAFSAAGDVVVSFSVDGPGALTPTTCETDGSGECTVELNSSSTGLSKVTASADVPVDQTSISVSTNGQAGNSDPAEKQWVDAQLTLTPEEDVNDVDDTHTFTATLMFDYGDGNGFVNAPDGETIDFSKTGVGTLSASSCTTDGGDGNCTVDLDSDETGLSTVTASWSGGITVGQITASSSADSNDALKHWVDARLSVTPEEDANDVDDTHTFTATLEFDTGSGFGPAADQEISWDTDSGPGAFTPTTCTTDANGECSVDLTTDVTGLSVVVASWSGDISTAQGSASSSADSTPVVKRWVDARLSLTPAEATNRVNDPHTFTALLEFDYGDGGSWVPAPDGETIDFSKSGVGTLAAESCDTDGGDGNCTVVLDSDATGDSTVTASWAGVVATAEGEAASAASDEALKHWVDALIFIDPPQATNQVGDPHTFTISVSEVADDVASPADGVLVTATILEGPGAFVGGVNTCTTDALGECTVRVDSSETGLTVVQAAASVLVDTVQIPLVTDGTDPGEGPAAKRWVDARLALTPQTAANAVGDTHTFTALLEFDLGDGGGFVPAPAGETIAFSKVSGPGVLDPGTCATDAAGQCSIDLDSAETGLTRVTAAWSDTITTAEGTADAVASSNEAVKRWVDGRLTVTPAGATNVVNDTHVFTALLEFDLGDGGGFVPAPGEVIAFSKISGPGTLGEGCTTGAAGTCTVNLDSSESGVTEVLATWIGDIEVQEGTASASFTGSATKDWVTPAIQIVKTATPDVGPPRDVTYSYTVTNIGDVTLTDVLVTDDVLGEIGTIDVLEPGESAVLSSTVAVDATSPVVNVGTACGDPTVDGEVIGAEVCDDDDATISVVLGTSIVAPQVLPRTGTTMHLVTFLAAMLVWLGAAFIAEDRFRWLRKAR